MLFDLRSRRRRGVVRVIYIFLAIVMVGGLLLVGVGTQGGGILNAVGNGSGNSNSGTSAAVTKALNKAKAKVKANPDSAAAWAALFQARYDVADSGSNVTSAGAENKAGLAALVPAAAAWEHYLTVSKQNPSALDAQLAARVYEYLEQWSNESSAWEYTIQASPKTPSAKAYICLALSSYAAGQSSKGDLAQAKALQLTPTLQRLTIKADFKKAAKSATTAKELVLENC